MSRERNKMIALQIIEDIFNGKDLDSINSLVAPDIIVHDTDKELTGLEELKEGVASLHSAFADLHYTIADIVAEHDRVAIRAKGKGTHKGFFRGIDATGRSIDYTVMFIWRFSNDQLAEHWSVSDVLGIFQQLQAGSSPHGKIE